MYPRKRWASNINSNTTVINVPVGQSGSNATYTICTNSAQTATPTPVLVKFGRLRKISTN